MSVGSIGSRRYDRKAGGERSFFEEWSRGRVISKKQRDEHRRSREATRKAPASGPRQHEAVVKVIGWGKSPRAARHLAAYITRTRPADGPDQGLTAYSDTGTPIPPDQVKTYIENWGLLPDSENLSKVAKDATPEERRLMDEKTRLNRRQSGHLIFSVPAKADASPEQVRAAVTDTLSETLGAAGVNYIYVIHTDHTARPHAHVLFSARTENGDQLRLGPEDLRAIRGIYARNAQEQGIPLVATAREDRPELAQAIADGRVPLRQRASYVNGKRNSREQVTISSLTPEQKAAELDRRMTEQFGKDWRQRMSDEIRGSDAPSQLPIVKAERRIKTEIERGTMQVIERAARSQQEKANWLALQAPAFAARHGAAYEQRRAGEAETAPKPKPVALPPLHPKAQQHVDRAFSAYEQPDEAKQRWLELFAEKPRFGIWALNNRPELFGQIKDQAEAPRLTQRDAQIPQSWRNEAARSLATAEQPSPLVAQATQRIAESARRTVEAQRTESRRQASQSAIARANSRFGEIPGITLQPTPNRQPDRSPAEDPQRPSWWRRVIDRTGKPGTPDQATTTPGQETPARRLPSWWRKSDQPAEVTPKPAPAVPKQPAAASEPTWSDRYTQPKPTRQVAPKPLPAARVLVARDLREIRLQKDDPAKLQRAQANLVRNARRLSKEDFAGLSAKALEHIANAQRAVAQKRKGRSPSQTTGPQKPDGPGTKRRDRG